MIILFGTRTYLYQLAILTLVCGRCGNPAAHTLRKRVMKFTLFFVPLFPISTKYTTQCTFCGVEHQLPKEQAEALLASVAPSPAAPEQGQLDQGAQTGAQGQAGPYGQPGGFPQQDGQQGPGGAPQQNNPYQS